MGLVCSSLDLLPADPTHLHPSVLAEAYARMAPYWKDCMVGRVSRHPPCCGRQMVSGALCAASYWPRCPRAHPAGDLHGLGWSTS